MTFYIGHISIQLHEDPHGLLLTAFGEVWPLPGQSPGEAQALILKNFDIVKAKYAETTSNAISDEELDEICLHIVLYYFYLYNSWKAFNEKEKNRDLAFQQKDFTHPYTYDKVIRFFKHKYPDDYLSKCALMLDLTPDAVSNYEATRSDFYQTFR